MTPRLIDLLLAFGVVVVVPLALRLRGRRRLELVVSLGVVAAFSFLLPRGPAAAALTIPWGIGTLYLAFGRIRALNFRSFDDLLRSVPAAYLVVGAGWLALSRYGARPLGFGDEIVELTAIHFHYAGFVAPTLMFQLWRWLRDNEPSGAAWGRGISLAVVAATPITAAGITFALVFGALGAAMFSIALTTASVLVFLRVIPNVGFDAAIPLGISSLSVIATMALAVAYSMGQWIGTPAPSLRTMVWTHGIANAVGFGLTGLIGWTVVRSQDGKRGPEGPLVSDRS